MPVEPGQAQIHEKFRLRLQLVEDALPPKLHRRAETWLPPDTAVTGQECLSTPRGSSCVLIHAIKQAAC